MKITTLLENTTLSPELRPEHGLSLFVETDRTRFLFDAGQSGAFADNAAKRGVDLKTADFAVLSHGHYDHGGGLADFLTVNQTAPVYVSRYAFEEHRNKAGKDIGLSPALSESKRLIFTDEVCRIGKGLTLYSCNETERRYPSHSGGMTAMGEAEDFRHEQYLLVEADEKRVLISGCSHKGILNAVEWFKPDVLVGGFHLSSLPCGEELTAVAESLAAYDTDYITCHCTGVEQYRWMRQSLPRLRYLAAGETVEI